MIFHLARLVEWRHPSLMAPAPLGAAETAALLQVACPACDLGDLAAPDDAPDTRPPAHPAEAARRQLAAECPDHAARFLVAA